MEAKDRGTIQQEILQKYPGTDPEIDIDWDIVEISFKAGQDTERKRIRILLYKLGYTRVAEDVDIFDTLKNGGGE